MKDAQAIKVVVVGYGNIGRFAIDAILQEGDIELCAVVDPFLKEKPLGFPDVPLFATSDEVAVGFADVALLAVPTRQVGEIAKQYLAKGISTVDVFDMHGEDLWQLYSELDEVAKKHNAASLISSGWDPGTDSLIRSILHIMIPRGITYTNFGPGMSMGHSVAAKAIAGVEDAVSITAPKGSGLHRRLVYVKAKANQDTALIEKSIKEDPYFAHDETYVFFINDLEDVRDFGHGALIERKGRSGIHSNQRASFTTEINNPAVTSQVLVASARAIVKQAAGAYVITQVPLADFINLKAEDMIKSLI